MSKPGRNGTYARLRDDTIPVVDGRLTPSKFGEMIEGTGVATRIGGEFQMVEGRAKRAAKKIVGIRCPNCGKFGWRAEFRKTVLSDVKIGSFLSFGRRQQSIEIRHLSCGYSSQQTHEYLHRVFD
jgi:hypothetical protein